MDFGHDAQHAALGEDRGAVVERGAVAQRNARDDGEGQLARGPHDLGQRLVGRVEQGGLQQQIAARVSGDGQLGEDDDLHTAARGLLGQSDDAPGVVRAVGDPHQRNGRGDFQKTEIIQFIKVKG